MPALLTRMSIGPELALRPRAPSPRRPPASETSPLTSATSIAVGAHLLSCQARPSPRCGSSSRPCAPGRPAACRSPCRCRRFRPSPMPRVSSCRSPPWPSRGRRCANVADVCARGSMTARCCALRHRLAGVRDSLRIEWRRCAASSASARRCAMPLRPACPSTARPRAARAAGRRRRPAARAQRFRQLAAFAHRRPAAGARSAACGRPSARCSRIWRGVESSRSAPRTTSVMPCAASSTTTASW